MDTLLRFVRDRQMLVVLDNCGICWMRAPKWLSLC
jgi:hypothetical protein